MVSLGPRPEGRGFRLLTSYAILLECLWPKIPIHVRLDLTGDEKGELPESHVTRAEECCRTAPISLRSSSLTPAARSVLEAAYRIDALAEAISDDRAVAVALYEGPEEYRQKARQIQYEIDLLATAIAYDRSHPNDALPNPEGATEDGNVSGENAPPADTSEETGRADDSGSVETENGRSAERAYLDALEATYINAKNGAVTVGDQSAAAKFFIKEKLFARKQHWRRMIAPRETGGSRDAATRFPRLWGVKDWVSNGFFWLVAGYGEKPVRVVLSAVFVVLLSAVFYWLRMDWFRNQFMSEPPLRPYGYQQLEAVHLLGYQIGDIQFVEYLILSIEAFVTLVLVGPGGNGGNPLGPWTHLIAEIEGFLGLFFVALFVFALTRSVHR